MFPLLSSQSEDLKRMRQFPGEKVLVTGASGYIGPHLCLRLCKSGDEVHAVSRLRQHWEGGSPSWWQADLTDIDVVRDLLQTTMPDVIFHLAGHAAGGRELELVLPTFHSNLATTVVGRNARPRCGLPYTGAARTVGGSRWRVNVRWTCDGCPQAPQTGHPRLGRQRGGTV